MAVLSVAQVLSGSPLALTSGIDDVLVVDIAGSPVLYALNRAENRLLELSISGTGQVSLVNSVQFAGTTAAGTEARLTAGSSASEGAFLAISGVSPQDGQMIPLSVSGALGVQEELSGVGTVNQAVSMTLGASSLLVSASQGGGLETFWDDGQGYLSGSSLADSADRYLADVAGSVGFLDGGTPYIATVSATEHGVNVASVQQSGLVQTGSIGAAETLPVGTPLDIAALTHFGTPWLFIASEGTSSLSVLQVSDGVPLLSDHVYDNAITRFQGASEVTAVSNGDVAYVAVGGAEGGVSLFTMLPGGRLVHLDSVAEEETVPLDQIGTLDAFVADDAIQIVAASSREAGLTRLTYDVSQFGSVELAPSDGSGAAGTGLDDQVIGSVAGEALFGLAGDDILVDGHGIDTLSGGPGADLFVFTADGQADMITDFELGVDRLDLSAFDFLYYVSQLNVAPTATGATLSFVTETLNLVTVDQTPLAAQSLTTADIVNVDRPPFFRLDGTSPAPLRLSF